MEDCPDRAAISILGNTALRLRNDISAALDTDCLIVLQYAGICLLYLWRHLESDSNLESERRTRTRPARHSLSLHRIASAVLEASEGFNYLAKAEDDHLDRRDKAHICKGGEVNEIQ